VSCPDLMVLPFPRPSRRPTKALQISFWTAALAPSSGVPERRQACSGSTARRETPGRMSSRQTITALAAFALVVCAIQFGAYAALRVAIRSSDRRPAHGRGAGRMASGGGGSATSKEAAADAPSTSWADGMMGWDMTLEPDPMDGEASDGDGKRPNRKDGGSDGGAWTRVGKRPGAGAGQAGRKGNGDQGGGGGSGGGGGAAASEAEALSTGALAGCARVRSGRLLLYAAHSGFGNQVRCRPPLGGGCLSTCKRRWGAVELEDAATRLSGNTRLLGSSSLGALCSLGCRSTLHPIPLCFHTLLPSP